MRNPDKSSKMGWIRTPEALTKIKDLILKGSYPYTFDGIPLEAKHLSLKKRINLLLAGLDMLLARNRCLSLPPVVMVQPTNICNLNCPLCPAGTGALMRSKGMMSYETFEAVLDKLEDVLVSIYFYSFGEPCLNKNLPWMIAEATRRNILSLVSTNGHFIQEIDEAMAFVNAGLKVLIIALDGSTQELYQEYRTNGDIEKVKRCASAIREAKVRSGSLYPYTVIRAVAMRTNEKDLPNIERLAEDLGADMFSYKSVGCKVDDEAYDRFVPEDVRLRRFSSTRQARDFETLERCSFPVRQPVIYWDGSIAGCEYDYDLEFKYGHIADRDFRKTWNGANAVRLRKSILRNANQAAFCLKRCPYRQRKADGVNLYSREFRPLGCI